MLTYGDFCIIHDPSSLQLSIPFLFFTIGLIFHLKRVRVLRDAVQNSGDTCISYLDIRIRTKLC